MKRDEERTNIEISHFICFASFNTNFDYLWINEYGLIDIFCIPTFIFYNLISKINFLKIYHELLYEYNI